MGYLVPGRDGLGVPPDAQSSAAVAGAFLPLAPDRRPTGAMQVHRRRPRAVPRGLPPSPGGPYAVHIDRIRDDGPYKGTLKDKNEG